MKAVNSRQHIELMMLWVMGGGGIPKTAALGKGKKENAKAPTMGLQLLLDMVIVQWITCGWTGPSTTSCLHNRVKQEIFQSLLATKHNRGVQDIAKGFIEGSG